MKVRIGIDVGGTFTDAVVLDNDTFELIGYLKVPTTHTAKEGVAKGIIEAVDKVIKKYDISPEDVTFIAHGTTQATNALLEGDVAQVGIVGIGSGSERIKAKADTAIGDIELAKTKFLHTKSEYVDYESANRLEQISNSIQKLVDGGAEVIVASGAFSVDDPTAELDVIDNCQNQGILSTGGHDITKLYGLKIRTRTAAINASILPKMIETATMTDESVHKSGITAPLMIMRCDGGVMDVQEVKKRPVLTMLSGPAAGVAGALMYEKISNGIFLEVGGTSTDISVIRDGQVMIKYAEVGGHKTYVNSLDVHTVGVAGGSMVRVEKSGVVEVGPRSAHIASLDYACFIDPDEVRDSKLIFFSPKSDDPENYVKLQNPSGKEFTITVTCAANYLGYVREGDYSFGNKESAGIALKICADYCGLSVETFARQILEKANSKNRDVLKELIEAYKLDARYTTLIGGGGGSAAIVRHLGEWMNMDNRIAKNAEVISPIGVALAMVRDMVERTIINPSDEDILRIKTEAYDRAIESGAHADTIEVNVEIDTSRNLVRAIATGATELRTKDLLQRELPEEELRSIVANTLSVPDTEVVTKGTNGKLYVMEGKVTTGKFIFKKTTYPVRVIDNEGVIRLQKPNGKVSRVNLKNLEQSLETIVDGATTYSDGGAQIPDVFILKGKQIKSYSGLIKKSQIVTLASAELRGENPDNKILALACEK